MKFRFRSLLPLEANASSGNGDMERRVQPDRREQPTGPWTAFPLAGRRMHSRRSEEHRRFYFVDRFSPSMLLFVLMLLIASMTDAVLTIQLIEVGAQEINPLMHRLLGSGVMVFLMGKYVLTAVGLPLLLIFKNHYLFGSPVRVGHLIPVIVALYAILIGYQLCLMSKHVWLC